MAGYLFSFFSATLLSYYLSPIDDNYSVCRTIRRASTDTKARTQCVLKLPQYINNYKVGMKPEAHCVSTLNSTCKLGYKENILKRNKTLE